MFLISYFQVFYILLWKSLKVIIFCKDKKHFFEFFFLFLLRFKSVINFRVYLEIEEYSSIFCIFCHLTKHIALSARIIYISQKICFQLKKGRKHGNFVPNDLEKETVDFFVLLNRVFANSKKCFLFLVLSVTNRKTNFFINFIYCSRFSKNRLKYKTKKCK